MPYVRTDAIFSSPHQKMNSTPMQKPPQCTSPIVTKQHRRTAVSPKHRKSTADAAQRPRKVVDISLSSALNRLKQQNPHPCIHTHIPKQKRGAEEISKATSTSAYCAPQAQRHRIPQLGNPTRNGINPA
ncbi:hypothetical protein ABVK25_000857 [Lepraria finkii]|uniref:Uncharacterized protein n=1 Tax=Lepraria finkii TaxID=1340010 RepID=A0ABR4BP39_9LECA